MEHKSVLLCECIEGLNIRPDGIYVDCTLGRGGHSREILKRLETGKLIGLDRDETAIRETGERLSEFGDKAILVHSNFSGIGKVLDDLGVSSPQLDDGSRGFSYMADAPLDMRMDRSSSLSAFDVVNHWDEYEIRRILWDYGEERYAPQIASAIARKREEKDISTTLELVDIIRLAMPAKALREKQHPAKRSFQAIRIAVNDELGEIKTALETSADKLNKKGRICVISFHSLEDRIIKSAFQARENGCTCPREFPVCVCGFKQTLKTVTRKPIYPSEEELNENPRARSAKLRIAERI